MTEVNSCIWARHLRERVQCSAQAAGCSLTNGGSHLSLWLVLVGLEVPEHLGRRMQGLGPQDAQLGEVQHQQANLAHEAVLLQYRGSAVSAGAAWAAAGQLSYPQGAPPVHVPTVINKACSTLHGGCCLMWQAQAWCS